MICKVEYLSINDAYHKKKIKDIFHDSISETIELVPQPHYHWIIMKT